MNPSSVSWNVEAPDGPGNPLERSVCGVIARPLRYGAVESVQVSAAVAKRELSISIDSIWQPRRSADVDR